MLRTAIPASHLPHSGIREIVDLALGSSSPMIRLEIGEPDFPTPAHVIDAAFEAARKKTSYVQTAGIPVLREAITDRLEADYGVRAPIERVLISHGAVQAVDAVMAAVVAAGDEVLIPDPAWPNYEMQATLLGATPVHYGLRPDDAFQPDIAEIRALVTPRTRVIVINSPSNPTGAVMPAETVAAIVEFAVSRDILVISDEVYDEMVFDGGHTTAAALAPHNVVSVFSFSKTYAMTGWRVGYALVPGWLADTVVRILEPAVLVRVQRHPGGGAGGDHGSAEDRRRDARRLPSASGSGRRHPRRCGHRDRSSPRCLLSDAPAPGRHRCARRRARGSSLTVSPSPRAPPSAARSRTTSGCRSRPPTRPSGRDWHASSRGGRPISRCRPAPVSRPEESDGVRNAVGCRDREASQLQPARQQRPRARGVERHGPRRGGGGDRPAVDLP